jgi:hypothetical protein
LWQIGDKTVATRTGHPGIRISIQEALPLEELKVRNSIIADKTHQFMNHQGVVVYPGEQIIVTN